TSLTMGVEAFDVHELLMDTLRQGFSWLEVVGARRFEAAPAGTKEHDEQVKFQDEIEVNGRISIEKVASLSAEYKTAMEQGLEWVVVRHQVDQHCPGLAGFLQAAGNAGHGTQRQQTKMQTLLHIHQKATRKLKQPPADPEAIWAAITSDIERVCPFLKGQVVDMCMFVRHYSGGEGGQFLKDLDAYSKSLTLRRDVPGMLFKALSQVKLAQGPEYLMSCIMASLVAPDGHVQQGVARPLHSADAATIDKKNKSAKAHLAKACLPAAAKTRLLGEMQVRFVMHIQKKSRGRREFGSLLEIADAFLEDVGEAAPDALQLQRPWAASEDKSETQAPSQPAQGSGSGLVEFTETGVGEEAMAAGGFVVGAMVFNVGAAET
ncbi:unnamed protein product, partial [Prorocentrum cordatum]